MVKKFDSNAQRLKRHKRVRAHISGTPARPRLDVFRSAKNIYAQIIDDVNGVTLAAAAKKVGQMVAERALAKGIEEVVFDRGGYVYHGRVQALADAAREGGLKF